MATIRGPLMSLEASGTIGQALTYGKWKGRAVVRERVTPNNPQSPGQVGRRAMWKFLTQNWDAIPAGTKATWQEIADALTASPFNGYLAVNAEGWHNFLAPSQAFPAGRALTPSDRALSTAAWEENRIKLTHACSSVDDGWGHIIFANLAGAVTCGTGSAIIAELADTTDNLSTFWTPPSLGRWYFDTYTFSTDGKLYGPRGGKDTGP